MVPFSQDYTCTSSVPCPDKLGNCSHHLCCLGCCLHCWWVARIAADSAVYETGLVIPHCVKPPRPLAMLRPDDPLVLTPFVDRKQLSTLFSVDDSLTVTLFAKQLFASVSVSLSFVLMKMVESSKVSSRLPLALLLDNTRSVTSTSLIECGCH